jgi:hypothetical protein
MANSFHRIPSSEIVINQAAARRLNRQNQKAKRASAATSVEGTPERSTELGKRTHATDEGSRSDTHRTKKARLDSTLHLQEAQATSTIPGQPSEGPQDAVIGSIALADADIAERTFDAELVSAVLAAEEAGLKQAVAKVTQDEDELMQ